MKGRKVRMFVGPSSRAWQAQAKAYQALQRIALRAFDHLLQREEEEIIAQRQVLKRRLQLLGDLESVRGFLAKLLKAK